MRISTAAIRRRLWIGRDTSGDELAKAARAERRRLKRVRTANLSDQIRRQDPRANNSFVTQHRDPTRWQGRT